MNYTKKVLEHFKKPKHVGEIKSPDGIGNVGNIKCGDTMKLFIKVKDNIIKDVKFKTFGCAAAIASSDILCDIVIGKSVDEAKKLNKDDVVKELGDLPPAKLHCSLLAIDALKKAIEDYEKKNSQKINRSSYKFLWGNHQSNLTIQMNFNCFIKFSDIVWNQVKNIIEVSKDNNISCFHSKEDLENDVERGKLYFDRDFVKKFISDLKKRYNEHWFFFNSLKQIDFSKLSDEQLFEYFLIAADNWSRTMGFFRATQAEGTYYITKELKKYFSEEEASILMIPQKLDIINKEILEWQGLIKKPCSREILIEHAEKYPWLVAGHVTYDDVIETLTQRYDYNKEHFEFKDMIKEKKELKEKQKKIISKAPKLKPIVELSQRLALLRMKVKSCWAGTEFYIIPIYREIAKRTNEDIYDIHKYYLIDEVKQLLEGINLSKEEKEKRKRCFVGLWKEGKALYKSGEEAEKLAKKELKGLYEVKKTDEIRGTTANSGKAKGIARILRSNDVQQAREFRKNFENGQILITQMTQPGIMDIAMRASAIVTDEGGLLSHAAIISREFKIPCIVGTEKATKVFKDGDLIEVDAYKGIVKKAGKK